MDLKKLIKINCGITEFNGTFAGVTIYMFLGAMDAGIMAGFLKLSGMVANIASGYIQSKFSDTPVIKLFNISFKLEIVSTMIYSVGNIVIAYNFKVGIGMLLLGRITHMIMCAFADIKVEHFMTQLTDGSVTERSAWRGEIKSTTSMASAVGTACNIGVFALINIINIPAIDGYRYILITHGVLGVLDLYVSYIELNMGMKIFKDRIKA